MYSESVDGLAKLLAFVFLWLGQLSGFAFVVQMNREFALDISTYTT